MLELKDFDEVAYRHYPYVENLCDEIVPKIARVQLATPDFGGLSATLVVDANGIQVMIYDETGKLKSVFCRELYPFPLAVYVAEHLVEPLDPAVLIRFGFEKFK